MEQDPGADSARVFDQSYLLEGELGRGAHGVVYRAKDHKLDQEVAIKVLGARLPDGSAEREDFRDRVQALSSLEHPNLARVSDFGVVSDAPYLVMELVEGETLEARLSRGPLEPDALEALATLMMRGLGYMHTRGSVHGELNARHVITWQNAEQGEQLKLLGYGMTGAGASADATYVAPELTVGNDPDARSDVYAAGALLLEMSTGSEGADAGAMGGASTLLPGQVDISELQGIIARALAADPSERFGNADQMLKALLALPSPWVPRAEPTQADAPADAPEEVEELDVDGPDVEEVPLELGVAPSEAPPYKVPKRRSPALKRALLGVAFVVVSGGAAAAWWQHRAATQAELTKQVAPSHAADAPAARVESGKEPPTPQPSAAATQPDVAKADTPATRAGHAQQGDAPGSKRDPREPSTEHAPAEASPQPAAAASNTQSSARAPADVHAPGDPPPRGAQTAAPTLSAQRPEPAARAQPAEPHGNTEPGPQAAAPKPSVPPTELRGNTKPGSAAPAPPAQRAEPEHAAKAPDPASPPSAAEEPPKPKPKPEAPYRHVRPTISDLRQFIRRATAPTKPRTAAEDPWAGPMSKALEALRTSISRGNTGSPQVVSALRRFNRGNPEAPHGHLLLAALYMNRGWPLDALDEYEVAYQIDPSSRGAPEMLSNVLAMVIKDQGAPDAARFIQRVYQREALRAIDTALQDPGVDAGALTRLRNLRVSLASAPANKHTTRTSKAPPANQPKIPFRCTDHPLPGCLER